MKREYKSYSILFIASELANCHDVYSFFIGLKGRS